MPRAIKARTNGPHELTLRSYNVGFGDCFLLTFHYAAFDRHVLIDFGSMRAPPGKSLSGNLLEIARCIEKDCAGKLHAVVATHRHQDHISGFTYKGGSGPGAIIRALAPDIVIQPWTEDPQAQRDALEPTKVAQGKARKAVQQHLRTLNDMNRFAGYAEVAASHLKGSHLAELRNQLEFLGGDNKLPNRDAVENLMEMSPERRYVYAGASAGLEHILPGVVTHVLGPPTLKQDESIRKQNPRNPDQYWHLVGARSSFWAKRGRIAMFQETSGALFPEYVAKRKPWDMRWYRYQAQQEHAENMLSIVRQLDNQMNNTSVILLFEIGGKFVLFPGDAQYENWQYALSDPAVVDRLARVGVYKVGHHGSLNATPKDLWNGFAARGGKTKKDRLITLLSTLDHAHGHEESNTEVPRRTLVKALQTESQLYDTRAILNDQYRSVVRIPL